MIKLLNEETGSSIVEAMMAMVVLIIGALAVWSAFVVGSRFNAESEDKTVAANIAQLRMEEIKNTHYLSIVYKHPPGEYSFQNEPQESPYWTMNSQGEWITSLPEGKYEIVYPGLDLEAGIIPDPLVVRVVVSWVGDTRASSNLSLKTIFSMAPGPTI